MTHRHTRGYAFKVTRTTPNGGARMVAFGTHTGPENWEAEMIADREVRNRRTVGSYAGPLRVAVWEIREMEGPTRPAPKDAKLFDYPAVHLAPKRCRSGECTHASRGEYCG